MKTILKIVIGLLFAFGIAAFTIPYLFKDKIMTFIKKDMNNSLKATFDFKDASTGIISDFPNLYISLYEVSLDGVNEFKDVRLLDAEKITLSLDLKSVLFGEQVIIKKFSIDKPFLTIRVLKNGLANYNISKDSSSKKDTDSNFDIKIERYEINNASLDYNDQSLGISTYFSNFYHKGKGVLTNDIYRLETHSNIDKLTFIYDGVKYLNNVTTQIETGFDISGDFNNYTLRNTQLFINSLPISAKGSIKLQDDSTVIDLNFQSDASVLDTYVKLIPEIYLEDIRSINTTGEASLNGFVKGKLTESDYPSFGIEFAVKNGSIQYPDLPEKIDNINTKIFIGFDGGSDLDRMSIDLSNMYFTIADNVVKGRLKISNTISNPIIDTHFASTMALNKIKRSLKIKGLNELEGLLDADVTLKGSISDLEMKDYNKFYATGFFNVKNFIFSMDSIPYPIKISKASTEITPQFLKVTNFKMTFGESDFNLKGKISNYLSYILESNQLLEANFNLYSNKLNLNEFMSINHISSESSKDYEKIDIPKDIIVSFQLNADNVLYKDLLMQDMSGNVLIKDQKVDLSAIFMKMMEGNVKLKGSYDAKEEKPISNLSFTMNQLDIEKSANSFTMFSSYAPILSKFKGKFFSSMDFDVTLDDKMNPVLKTLNVIGNFKTDQLSSEHIDILTTIADIIKVKELKNPSIDKINASFSIKNGNFNLKPIDFKINTMKANLLGSIGVNKKLNLSFTIDVPREKLGNNVNQILQDLAGGIQFLKLNPKIPNFIKFKFKITGLVSKPTIKPIVLSNEEQTLDQAITELVTEQFNEVKESAIEKATKEADTLLVLAQREKEKLLEKAQITAEKINGEAKIAADKLVTEAGNDPLKKLGAKLAADKLIKEAKKQSETIIIKAENTGDDLIEKAKLQGKLLIEKASNQVVKDSI